MKVGLDLAEYMAQEPVDYRYVNDESASRPAFVSDKLDSELQPHLYQERSVRFNWYRCRCSSRLKVGPVRANPFVGGI